MLGAGFSRSLLMLGKLPSHRSILGLQLSVLFKDLRQGVGWESWLRGSGAATMDKMGVVVVQVTIWKSKIGIW